MASLETLHWLGERNRHLLFSHDIWLVPFTWRYFSRNSRILTIRQNDEARIEVAERAKSESELAAAQAKVSLMHETYFSAQIQLYLDRWNYIWVSCEVESLRFGLSRQGCRFDGLLELPDNQATEFFVESLSGNITTSSEFILLSSNTWDSPQLLFSPGKLLKIIITSHSSKSRFAFHFDLKSSLFAHQHAIFHLISCQSSLSLSRSLASVVTLKGKGKTHTELLSDAKTLVVISKQQSADSEACCKTSSYVLVGLNFNARTRAKQVSIVGGCLARHHDLNLATWLAFSEVNVVAAAAAAASNQVESSQSYGSISQHQACLHWCHCVLL